jgi:hypothetical protein
VMTLGIISFYRPLLHREQGSILCDNWFHNRLFEAFRKAISNEFPRPLAGVSFVWLIYAFDVIGRDSLSLRYLF